MSRPIGYYKGKPCLVIGLVVPFLKKQKVIRRVRKPARIIEIKNTSNAFQEMYKLTIASDKGEGPTEEEQYKLLES